MHPESKLRRFRLYEERREENFGFLGMPWCWNRNRSDDINLLHMKSSHSSQSRTTHPDSHSSLTSGFFV
jgi:hypothetical protein